MPDPSTPTNDASVKAIWAREVRRRLASLRLSPTREAEIVEELSQHLDDRYRELLAGGASPDEARRLALADFRRGNVLAQYMTPLRQSHAPPPITPGAATGHTLSDLWQDLRHAARMCAKRPGFAAASVLTLALGIGATTAIFSVVYGVLLKPLPFQEPERLAGLYHRGPGVSLPVMNQGPATYFIYRDNQRAFEDIGAWDGQEVSITGLGEPERVDVLAVTDGTLPLLRVQPLLGRLFSRDDDRPGSPVRVVLTHGYWQRRFGGAENVIGQSLVIDGTAAEIIGVLPSSFTFLHTDPEVLLPLQPDRADADGVSFGFQAVGRLRPGATLAEANADIARMVPL
ncbi:MAG: ABC transporter permease, partial [Vicinamibacteraceae bacterium]